MCCAKFLSWSNQENLKRNQIFGYIVIWTINKFFARGLLEDKTMRYLMVELGASQHRHPFWTNADRVGQWDISCPVLILATEPHTILYSNSPAFPPSRMVNKDLFFVSYIFVITFSRKTIYTYHQSPYMKSDIVIPESL